MTIPLSPTGKAKDCVEPACPLKTACKRQEAQDSEAVCILHVIRDCEKDCCLVMEDLVAANVEAQHRADELDKMVQQAKELRAEHAAG